MSKKVIDKLQEGQDTMSQESIFDQREAMISLKLMQSRTVEEIVKTI